MYTAVAPYAASFVAKDQGFFEKRGIDADLILAANGSAIVAGVVAGQVRNRHAHAHRVHPGIRQWAVAFSPDGHTLAATGADGSGYRMI